MPRGCYEPWGILRKPIPAGMKLSDCLREFQTGGLRRNPDGTPLGDVISSERTPQKEREDCKSSQSQTAVISTSGCLYCSSLR